MYAAVPSPPVDITIIVKALNEEQNIEACLRSARCALDGVPALRGEILLADSVSTDRTVEIAAGLDARIVQFENVSDRSCGAALQLGYQYAQGRYLYVLDGDMQMVPEFLARAYAYLQDHPRVAGVGGKLVDTHIRTEADRRRNEYYASLNVEQDVHSLGGGGLYRRDAIDQVGYLSNRWLPAFEEAELAVRLRSAGHRLIRLSDAAIIHSGHAETSLQMLSRLWRNGRIAAIGMFLRSAVGQPWFGQTVKACWYVFAAPALYGAAAMLMIAGGLAGLSWPLLVMVPPLVWVAALALLSARKRSVQAGTLAVLSWHFYTLGALRGFFRPPADPMRPIPAREIGRRIGA